MISSTSKTKRVFKTVSSLKADVIRALVAYKDPTVRQLGKGKGWKKHFYQNMKHIYLDPTLLVNWGRSKKEQKSYRSLRTGNLHLDCSLHSQWHFVPLCSLGGKCPPDLRCLNSRPCLTGTLVSRHRFQGKKLRCVAGLLGRLSVFIFIGCVGIEWDKKELIKGHLTCADRSLAIHCINVNKVCLTTKKSVYTSLQKISFSVNIKGNNSFHQVVSEYLSDICWYF